MGYTHYVYQNKTLSNSFAKVVKDCKKLIPIFETMGIPLASCDGKGKPQITATKIAFNGLEKCGHEKRNLGITWPAKGAKGVNLAYIKKESVPTDTIVTMLSGEKEDLRVNDSDVDGTWFAGCKLNQRTCGGDCSHESFFLNKTFLKAYDGQEDKNGKWFSCCKTAYKPYDLAVISCLIIAKHYLKNEITVHSDGEMEHWSDGQLLCQKLLGYGAEFKLDD